LVKEEMDVDDDWVPDEDIAPIQKARILALKVCRNRCLANASAEIAVELATPVLKMFSTLLEHSGSFSADAPDRLGFLDMLLAIRG
jgi:sister-chromatid-cohesion protein PDS5